jgi:hypothetical protein
MAQNARAYPSFCSIKELPKRFIGDRVTELRFGVLLMDAWKEERFPGRMQIQYLQVMSLVPLLQLIPPRAGMRITIYFFTWPLLVGIQFK